MRPKDIQTSLRSYEQDFLKDEGLCCFKCDNFHYGNDSSLPNPQVQFCIDTRVN